VGAEDVAEIKGENTPDGQDPILETFIGSKEFDPFTKKKIT
jgi:hypothetical protein